MRTAIPARSHLTQGLCRRAALRFLASIVAVLLLAAVPLAASGQTAAAKPRSTTRKTLRTHNQPPTSAAPALAPEPAPPAAPKLPDWPANAHPAEATVVWNSGGLSIQAANSSLSQILKDVATATGAKVEGLAADQRIFGSYGPGAARDVLGKLLEGSGYNVLMIGDRGQGTPREILLSAKPSGNAPSPAFNNPSSSNPSSSNDDSPDAEEPPPEQPEPPQQPPNVRNGFAPGAPPRTPQQIMQEMQQRQMQTQQPPPNSPQ